MAYFNKLGTLPKESDKLNNGLTSEISAILINLGDIPSGPYDLLPFKILIWSRTSSSETVINSKISHIGELSPGTNVCCWVSLLASEKNV